MLREIFMYHLIFMCELCVVLSNCNVPKIRFEAFYPQGFQVYIPAEEMTQVFAFHGNLNKEMIDFEEGQWSANTSHSVKGRFVYKNEIDSLRMGDVVYYWTNITRQGCGLLFQRGRFVVTKHANRTRMRRDVSEPPNQSSQSECVPSVSIVAGVKQPCADRTMFFDEFDEIGVDDTKWNLKNQFSGNPDYEFVSYETRISTVYTRLKAKNLVLHPDRTASVYGDYYGLYGKIDFGRNCTGDILTEDCVREKTYDILPPIISPQITTKGKFSFKYGKVIIRAKVPNMMWAFPQFHLEPTDNSYGKFNYNSGLMRMAFVTGNQPYDLYGGIILSSDPKFRNLKMCRKVANYDASWPSDFHEYSLKWTPDAISVSVDGEEYCKITPGEGFGKIEVDGQRLPAAGLLTTGSKLAPFDEYFHVTIGVGFGGHYDFPDPIPYKPWENFHPRAMKQFWYAMKSSNYPNENLLVDYVHVLSV